MGAGIAGLAAGRALRLLGHEAVLFEADAQVGGRVQTEAIDGYVFDSGASSIAPRGLSIEAVLQQELDDSDLVRVELPIHVHSGLRIASGDTMKNMVSRYTYRSGMASLPALLAEGQDIRLKTTVEALEKEGDAFFCEGERFDAVIITPPAPVAKPLLLSVGQGRYLANTSYRSCLAVLLGFEAPLPNLNYHALLDPEQRHPLTWLCVESAKCPGRAPEGCTAIVAQLSPEYSRRNFETAEETIVVAALDFATRLYGKPFETPKVAKVVRWRYSHPETTSLFESANDPEDKVIVAGDGVMGARVEFAYESGIKAAQLLAGQRAR